MKKTTKTSEIVKFGGAIVRIKQRKNGFWMVRWREAGKDRSTTTTTLKNAQDIAKTASRKLASGSGKTVSAEEHELVARLKIICGTRSPFAVLNQLEDAVKRMNGWDVVGRALAFYEQSGMAETVPMDFHHARQEFLAGYEDKSNWTLAGLRKELDAFNTAHPGIMVIELTNLDGWIARGTPAPRFFNNRLATWHTFLNWSRRKNYWPKGEKHAAELTTRKDLPNKVPDIFTPEQAHAILKILPENLVPYFVIGSWLGLRPTEMLRLKWEHFDWERGYVNLDEKIVLKTQTQRFVPINDKARELLIAWEREKGKCCPFHSREEISKLARAAGIISEWPQDVLRHSYISYRIAQGASKGKVAEEAGNSEQVIRKNYRRPLRAEDGAAWFKI